MQDLNPVPEDLTLEAGVEEGSCWVEPVTSLKCKRAEGMDDLIGHGKLFVEVEVYSSS
jgi:hypothetical protein